ncbi:reticulocyte binding-like protein 2b [Ditylenchus destructor]|nr:reticulocyte binding-like protein 2b [Ditylenchus destructor]
MKEAAQVCNSEASSSKSLVSNDNPANKEFDDSCFKTPMLPMKRGSNGGCQSTKKRPGNRTNGQLTPTGDPKSSRNSIGEHDSNESSDKTVSSLTRLSIDGPNSTVSNVTPKNEIKEVIPLDPFVSIGKHSYLCPRAKQYVASRFPKLPQKRPSNENEDFVKEIIIDEFSLLLFSSLEDYNVLKAQEDDEKERLDAEEKQKQYEENLKSGKVKKKGRKSKLDLEKERKALKKKERQERRELKRQKKERKRQPRREHANLTAEERVDRRRERKERNKESTPKDTKVDKERRHEERRRLKQEKKLLKRPQQKTPASATANSTQVHTGALNNIPSTSAVVQLSASPSQSPSTSKVAATETLDWRSITTMRLSPSAGNKRPGSAIGIASQRNGVILSPIDNLNTTGTPPANKIKKMDNNGDVVEDSKSQTIGIAVKSENLNLENVKTEDSTAQRSTPKATPTNNMPTTSSSNGIGFGQSGLSSFGFPGSLATAQLNPLHQAFLNNPELAMNYHQSIASLNAVDPSLMSIAAAGFPPGFPFFGTPQFLQQMEQQRQLASATSGNQQSSVGQIPTAASNRPNSALKPTANSTISLSGMNPTNSATNSAPFALGSFPLASQLAGVAALAKTTSMINPPASCINQAAGNSTATAAGQKASRWCNMHVSLANATARHVANGGKNTSAKATNLPNRVNPPHQQTSQQQGQHMQASTSNNVSASVPTTKDASLAFNKQHQSLAAIAQQQQQKLQSSVSLKSGIGIANNISRLPTTSTQSEVAKKMSGAGMLPPNSLFLAGTSSKQASTLLPIQQTANKLPGDQLSTNSTSSSSNTAHNPNILQQKFPPDFSSMLFSQHGQNQLSNALGFPVAPASAGAGGLQGSLTSGTSAQAAISAQLSQHQPQNQLSSSVATSTAAQLALLTSQLHPRGMGMHLPPSSNSQLSAMNPNALFSNAGLPPNFGAPLQQQTSSALSHFNNANALASLFPTANASRTTNPQNQQHMDSFQAALLQQILSMESKSMPTAAANPSALDILRHQQHQQLNTNPSSSNASTMPQQSRLLDQLGNTQFSAGSSSSALFQQHNLQSMLFAQSIDQENMMRQKLFGQAQQSGGSGGLPFPPGGFTSSNNLNAQLTTAATNSGLNNKSNGPGLSQQAAHPGTGLDTLMLELSRQQGLQQLVAPGRVPQMQMSMHQPSFFGNPNNNSQQMAAVAAMLGIGLPSANNNRT